MFEPLQHQVHADCYGFLLVARRLGLNIFTNCISNGKRVLQDCLSRFPEVSLATDCDVGAVNFRSHWPTAVHQYIILPPSMPFSHIAEPRPRWFLPLQLLK